MCPYKFPHTGGAHLSPQACLDAQTAPLSQRCHLHSHLCYPQQRPRLFPLSWKPSAAPQRRSHETVSSNTPDQGNPELNQRSHRRSHDGAFPLLLRISSLGASANATPMPSPLGRAAGSPASAAGSSNNGCSPNPDEEPPSSPSESLATFEGCGHDRDALGIGCGTGAENLGGSSLSAEKSQVQIIQKLVCQSRVLFGSARKKERPNGSAKTGQYINAGGIAPDSEALLIVGSEASGIVPEHSDSEPRLVVGAKARFLGAGSSPGPLGMSGALRKLLGNPHGVVQRCSWRSTGASAHGELRDGALEMIQRSPPNRKLNQMLSNVQVLCTPSPTEVEASELLRVESSCELGSDCSASRTGSSRSSALAEIEGDLDASWKFVLKTLPEESAENPCPIAQGHKSGADSHLSSQVETTEVDNDLLNRAETTEVDIDFLSRMETAEVGRSPTRFGAPQQAEEDSDDSFVFSVDQNTRKSCQPIAPLSSSRAPLAARKFPACKSVGCRQFSRAELELATSQWSSAAILGKGSFGTVFRGQINGQAVAIKKLDHGASQGSREYQTEVEILSNIKHSNIVQLLGHCPEDHCLVYEFIPDGSLHDWLRDTKKLASLDWNARLHILRGLASALAALHDSVPAVVHRDLKPENVLLDHRPPKVGGGGDGRAGMGIPIHWAESSEKSSTMGVIGFELTQSKHGLHDPGPPKVHQGRGGDGSDLPSALSSDGMAGVGMVFLELTQNKYALHGPGPPKVPPGTGGGGRPGMGVGTTHKDTSSVFAKLADVGLARLLESDGEQTYTVSGTAGYIDPEGMKTFEVSSKGDVYAFGLIMLQLLFGEPRVVVVHQILDGLMGGLSKQSCRVDLVAPKLVQHLDSSLEDLPQAVALGLIGVALSCIQKDRLLRPGLSGNVIPILDVFSAVMEAQ